MKTLYVLRHAKSSWENQNQTDFERPLNERGLQTAPRIGKLMRAQKFIPDLIVSSPAARARITAEMVRDAASFRAEIQFDERIYEAAIKNLFEVLGRISNNAGSLLLVGHNPGLENLVERLTGEFRLMPTAALAVIELNIEEWSEIDYNSGRLCKFIVPKEIAD